MPYSEVTAKTIINGINDEIITIITANNYKELCK